MPYQATLDDIERLKAAHEGCGCHRRRMSDDSSWKLCVYHEGFDDGIETANRLADREEGR